MFKVHYESSFTKEKGRDGDRGSMISTLVRNDQGKKHGIGDTKYHFYHCTKVERKECKDEHPFFCALIAAISGGKGKSGARKLTGKCYVCKKTGHVKSIAPIIVKILSKLYSYFGYRE